MRFFRHRETQPTPNPKVDAVAVTKDGVAVLIMGYAMSMPIPSIEQRVQHYVGFALDGQMVKEFPKTAGKPVRITIAPDNHSSDDLEAYVSAVRPKLATYGITIEINRPK